MPFTVSHGLPLVAECCGVNVHGDDLPGRQRFSVPNWLQLTLPSRLWCKFPCVVLTFSESICAGKRIRTVTSAHAGPLFVTCRACTYDWCSDSTGCQALPFLGWKRRLRRRSDYRLWKWAAVLCSHIGIVPLCQQSQCWKSTVPGASGGGSLCPPLKRRRAALEGNSRRAGAGNRAHHPTKCVTHVPACRIPPTTLKSILRGIVCV